MSEVAWGFWGPGPLKHDPGPGVPPAPHASNVSSSGSVSVATKPHEGDGMNMWEIQAGQVELARFNPSNCGP